MTKKFNWAKHHKEKERRRWEDYHNGKICDNWKGASKHAKIVRNAKPPKPL